MAKPTRSQRAKARKLRQFNQTKTIQNTRIISKVFMQFSKDFIKDNNFAEEPQLTINYKVFSDAMRKALLQVWKATTEQSGVFVSNLFDWDIKKDIIKAISNNIIKDYNKKYAAKKVKNITKTTEKALNRIISKGQREGLNRNEIAKQIESRINEMSKARSKTIARTETANATETMNQQTAKEAGASNKIWLYTHASKTSRENHLAIDGQERKLDEKFNVSGYEADHPHDPNLPAEEIINCSCICLYQ